MPNDVPAREPTGLQIDLSRPAQLRYWTDVLQCSEADLREAVAAVGLMADRVGEYLCKRDAAAGWR